MQFSQGSKGGPRGAKSSPTVASVPWKNVRLNYWPSEYMIRSRLTLWHQHPEKMLHLTIGPQITWSDPGLSLVNPPSPLFMQNAYLIGIGAYASVERFCVPPQTALGVIGNIEFPSGGKDYKLYLHVTRDEFNGSPPVAPRLLTSNNRNVFPRLSQTAPIELMFGRVWYKFIIIMWM